MVHAVDALVEGTSETGGDAPLVNFVYRCDGPSCLFEAVLDGVSHDDVTEYEWRFSDGKTVLTTDPVVTRDWAESGSQSLTLMVHDQYCDPLVAEATFSTLASSIESDAGTSTDPDTGGATLLTAASVRLGQSARRLVSEPLEGTKVSGEVFVFVGALEGAKSVGFRLSDTSLGIWNLRLEKAAPFDLAGGSADSARPFDTRAFADGAYRLEVTALYSDGRTENVSVDFEIRNDTSGQLAEAPLEETSGDSSADDFDTPSAETSEPIVEAALPDEPDTSAEVTAALVFSKTSNRANSESLAGAVLDGNVYAYLEGADSADSVRFFLDDPALGGQPLQFEGSAPWDAMGGRKLRARPLDTRSLDGGRHVLSAEVVESGLSYVVHATFTVAN